MMVVNPWNMGFEILRFDMKKWEYKCCDKINNKSNLYNIISLFPIVLNFKVEFA
jgi:hypothetical protein